MQCRRGPRRLEQVELVCCRRRPYRVECTGSLLTSEVKQRRARSVLGWGTAWEDLRVLSAFHPAFNCEVHMVPLPDYSRIRRRIGSSQVIRLSEESQRFLDNNWRMQNMIAIQLCCGILENQRGHLRHRIGAAQLRIRLERQQ